MMKFGLWLLANPDLARSLSDYSDRSKTLSGNFYVISVVVSIVVFWVLIIYKNKIIRLVRPEKSPAEVLFDNLCQYHRLSRSEKKWLKELGEINRADQMAKVFVHPDWFSETQRVPAGSADMRRKMLVKLYGKDWTDGKLI